MTLSSHESSSLPDPSPEGTSEEQPLREISSADLLQGAKELLIRHGEDVYRLRLTRNGKLILQK